MKVAGNTELLLHGHTQNSRAEPCTIADHRKMDSVGSALTICLLLELEVFAEPVW